MPIAVPAGGQLISTRLVGFFSQSWVYNRGMECLWKWFRTLGPPRCVASLNRGMLSDSDCHSKSDSWKSLHQKSYIPRTKVIPTWPKHPAAILERTSAARPQQPTLYIHLCPDELDIPLTVMDVCGQEASTFLRAVCEPTRSHMLQGPTVHENCTRPL